VIAGKLLMPADLQRLHQFLLDSKTVRAISDEMCRGGAMARTRLQAALRWLPGGARRMVRRDSGKPVDSFWWSQATHLAAAIRWTVPLPTPNCLAIL
jgi:hypothetical protein